MIIIGLQAPIAVYTVMLPGPLTLKESRAEIVASVAGAKSEKRRRRTHRRRGSSERRTLSSEKKKLRKIMLGPA